MKKLSLKVTGLLAALALLAACDGGKSTTNSSKEPVDYVNPYAGNISHMLMPTYPTVGLPNGMMRAYPNRADYTTDQMNGLPVVVTGHRGFSPVSLNPTQAAAGDLQPVTPYSYDLEKITPYRYSVYLDEAHIGVDYAPSRQSAVYRFDYEGTGDAKLVVTGRGGTFQVNADGAIEGSQVLNRGNGTTLYLYIETQQPIASNAPLGERGGSLVVDFGPVKQVDLRYGISYISTEQAKKNLHREISGYNVQAVADAGRKAWNDALGKIAVTGGSESDKVVFYTSLYRTYERMINISEDGYYYSAYDSQVHNDGGDPFYVDDWIWDTYRATHPLRMLIEPEMQLDMLKSYIRIAEQTPEGWFPTFPGVAGDGHAMNCNHGVVIFADALAKGMTGFDLAAAYNAAKKTMTEKSILPWTYQPLTVLDQYYAEHGYLPAIPDWIEKDPVPQVHGFEQRQTIPVTLGTSYDDWCTAQLAKAMNQTEDYDFFMKRSLNYRNLYNPETGFFHPKNDKGEFIEPMDYNFSGGQGGRYYYDENNAWIYRWDVQHNVADLVSLMGGPEKFANNLDVMFRTPLGMNKYTFYAKFPDHTGNVGQFSMANEPCLHIPFLYNYAGQPWKTQKRTRELITQWFRNDLMGVPGDEDGGGMTAFVVFTQLGFYPVTPGTPVYVIGSPVFDKSVMDLGNGKTFTIEARNCSFDNKYIQSATLNGENWNKSWFTHDDIASGGTLVLEMGPKANTAWGSDLSNLPPSGKY